jgi:hypothetical protein
MPFLRADLLRQHFAPFGCQVGMVRMSMPPGSDAGDGVVEHCHRFPDGVLAHPKHGQGEVVVGVVPQQRAGPELTPSF